MRVNMRTWVPEGKMLGEESQREKKTFLKCFVSHLEEFLARRI